MTHDAANERSGRGSERSERGPASAWFRGVTWFVLAACVMASVAGAVLWRRVLIREEAASLRDSATTASAVVASNIALDDHLMDQLRGLIATRPDMSNAEFVDWIDAVGISETFPGGVGSGFIERVPAARLAEFAAAREQDPVVGLPTTGSYSVLPDTAEAEYCLQRVGAWETSEIQGFQVPPGLNFCAAELPGEVVSPLPALLSAATDRGLPAVLGPDQLIPGVFALFVPVYRGGATPSTVEERRAQSIGWVSGSFRSAALIDPALSGLSDGLHIDVVHHGPSGETLVASSADAEQADTEQADPAQAAAAKAHLAEPVISSVDVDPAWTIRVLGTASGLLSYDLGAAAVLGVGLALSLLAFLFLRLLGGSRDRALDLVEERTGELAYQALHDSLTGLPNRTLILDRASGALARARRDGQPVAAMFVDLDDFKAVNDTLGHGAGDELLNGVAKRFSAALRASDTVGRIGGDEFVILLEGDSLLAGPETVAERVLALLAEPFVLRGEPRRIAASIGIASGPRPNAEEWLRDADIALYEAKAAGKDCYVVFESEMQQAIQGRVALERELNDALAEEQFFLLYQPTFDLRTNEVTGVEALIRWAHPTRGVLKPADFIPVAERSGLITAVGRWALHEACRQGAEWNRRGQPLTIAVNVSGRQLADDDLVGDVRAALVDSGLAPASLVLELSEVTLIREAPTAATSRRMAELKQVGVRLAVDNFGTGYSPLTYLQQLPIDIIKIDRSFIAGMADSGAGALLLRSLVQLGQGLGFATLAEGIEEKSELADLVRVQCDSGQGYLFAPPLDPRELEKFLQIPPAPTPTGVAAGRDHR